MLRCTSYSALVYGQPVATGVGRLQNIEELLGHYHACLKQTCSMRDAVPDHKLQGAGH